MNPVLRPALILAATYVVLAAGRPDLVSHRRVGVPVTLLTLAVGVWWLS